MPRLLRPYIPLSVRLEVARRQLAAANCWSVHDAIRATDYGKNISFNLHIALIKLFGQDKYHLDHDPPLAARQKVWSISSSPVHIGYLPDANDPRYLIYRTVEDHRIKTNVRGEHGQHPDRVLIKRERRRQRKARLHLIDEMGKTPLLKRVKKSRWPKGRKLRSRSTFGGKNARQRRI